MPQITVQEIIAMPPGQDLDRAVHAIALGRPGRAPLYSTKAEVAIELVAQLPIGVSRLSQNSPGYKPDRPFIAFVLERHSQLLTWFTPTTVTAATIAVALSKMALIYSISSKERVRTVASNTPKIGQGLKPIAREQMPPRATATQMPPPPAAPTAI